MSEDSVPQERRHNPFTRSPAQGGKLLSAMQLPFFTIHPPNGFGVLTTIGRRSGKKRRKCVRVIVDDSTAYLVMLGPVLVPEAPNPISHWLQNIRANPLVRLRTRCGGSLIAKSGHARELTDSSELATARKAYTETINPFDFAEYRFHIGDRPTPEKIRHLHEHWFDNGVPMAIDLSQNMK